MSKLSKVGGVLAICLGIFFCSEFGQELAFQGLGYQKHPVAIGKIAIISYTDSVYRYSTNDKFRAELSRDGFVWIYSIEDEAEAVVEEIDCSEKRSFNFDDSLAAKTMFWVPANSTSPELDVRAETELEIESTIETISFEIEYQISSLDLLKVSEKISISSSRSRIRESSI